MSYLTRVVTTLLALLFAGVAVQFWVVPEQAAQQFGLAPIRDLGLTNLRADLGGLFLSLAVLCGAGAWARRRSALIAATVVLAGIIAGRAIGWVANGGVGAGVRELLIESFALIVLGAYAHSLKPAAAVLPPSLPAHRWLKIALATVSLFAFGAAVLLLTPSVQQSLFDRAAQKLTARTNSAPLVDDALRVAVCGSSAPLPSESRAKACVAVFAGGRFWVVDSGPESVENLVLWGLPLSEIGGVLLTHFHSDHIGDLGELQLQTWAGGRPAPLAVYGGPGVDRVVAGFNAAYQLDQGYRTAHHGEAVMPSASWGMVSHTVTLEGEPTAAKDRTGLVFDDGQLKITAIEVDHAPIEPAYAYRFDYKGRSAVITGDLKYHRPLVKSAASVDLLVSEAISRSMTQSLESAAHSGARERTAAIMHDVQDYHISPEEAASIANDANVQLLVYYHLLPAPDGLLLRRLFAQGVNEVRRGDWTIAEDGSLYTLPIGSKQVHIGHIQD
jgi:ribonuclease Z